MTKLTMEDLDYLWLLTVLDYGRIEKMRNEENKDHELKKRNEVRKKLYRLRHPKAKIYED